MEKPTATYIFCPEEICKLAGITNYMNKYGGPIWMDYQPGSYVNKDGKTVYSTNHKCEYVDKELIRDLFNNMKQSWLAHDENEADKYLQAIEYFLNN